MRPGYEWLVGVLVNLSLWHTELAITGVSLMVCVWKLKGALDAPDGGGGPILPSEVRFGVGNADEDMGEPP
jgi:hypothetical protein